MNLFRNKSQYIRWLWTGLILVSVMRIEFAAIAHHCDDELGHSRNCAMCQVLASPVQASVSANIEIRADVAPAIQSDPQVIGSVPSPSPRVPRAPPVR
jgi:hypothetical protein